MTKRTAHFLVLALLPLMLCSCARLDGFFSDSDLAPLTGERVSVLQLQRDLTPDPALQQSPVSIPQPWENKFWPQTGGYPNHVMGHLALEKEVKKAWSTSVGSGGSRRMPLIAQPVVAEGTVYTLDAEGLVSALRLSDGQRLWRAESVASDEKDSGALGGGLAYVEGKLYVANGHKYFVCMDAATGKVLWKAPTVSPTRSAPTVANDRVYLITMDNQLLVYSATDGTPLWNYAGVTETTNLLGAVSPAADGSVVILPLSSGEIFALRVENGQVVWEDSLSAVQRVGALSSIADIRGQPVIDRGVVYAASYSGRMAAFDEISGQRLWQREIGSAEMPWSAEETVFLLSADQQLIALTRQSGDVRWVTALPRFEDEAKDKPVVWTGPVLAGGRLILASNTGILSEVDPQDGKILKQSDLPGGVTIAPVVADNTLLLLTQSGALVAYR